MKRHNTKSLTHCSSKHTISVFECLYSKNKPKLKVIRLLYILVSRADHNAIILIKLISLDVLSIRIQVDYLLDKRTTVILTHLNS